MLFIMASLNSCSEEKNKDIRERNPDIELLGESLTLLKTTRDEARYGTIKGNYPEESKQILNDAMAVIARLIFRIENGETISEAEIAQVKTMTQNAIAEFNATVRTETLLYDAELYVDGDAGGYIDFGISSEYSRFGENGNQAYTVELWVKYKALPGGIGAIVSTFVENGGVRCGWMLNMINSDYLRMSCTSNLEHQMWEPGDGFTDIEKWVHVAAVYNDKGVDGDMDNGSPVVLKYYENGVMANKSSNSNPSMYYNPADDSKLPSLPMIAFAQHTLDGSRTRTMQGYIKHFRIWKTAKSPDEIVKLMNGTTVVTGNESDLSCAWPFDKQVEDDLNIKDLTGRHTAVLKGSYQWIILP
ncbi:MAG: DUF4972 domain-containing protein [Dysgonamonadaceae bacterium]|nr:DUF4972 domain-containing protein [Dysgonamonadaceae bacterium]